MPDQYFGYSLQAIRLLHLLLESGPGVHVSLEVFEDVGRVGEAGALASQVKSGLVKNPIADRAVDLWKTFANWVVAVKDGDLTPETTIFEIYLAKNHRGAIAESFAAATTINEAEDALDNARAILIGKGRRALATGLATPVKRVFEADRAVITKIIKNFKICAAMRDPLGDLRPMMAVKWAPEASTDILIQHAHGWLKEQTDRRLQERKPAIVSSDEFNEEMRRFLPRCDYRHMLVTMAGRPSPDQIQAERIRIPTYVRQLELIQLEDEGTLEAINDYLRAASARTWLSEQGIVHEESFEDFKGALVSFWRNKQRQNNLTHPGHDTIQKGQLLLTDCALHDQRLQGLDIPRFLTCGSFHALADKPEIGWHPDFKNLLGQAA
ncbi:MAG: ABC-three component system protein [Bryobacteraceae bacterium]